MPLLMAKILIYRRFIMINCDICKYKDAISCDCRHGENFERVVIEEPQKVHIRNGVEYCAHCGFIADYAKGYKKFYCIRCGGLNIRNWQ